MKRTSLFRPKRTAISSALSSGAIAILGVGLIGGILLHIPGLRDPHTLPKVLLVVFCAMLAALIFGARVLVVKKIQLRRTPVDAAALIFLVVALLAWVLSGNLSHGILGQPEVFGLSLASIFGAIAFGYMSAQHAARGHVLHRFIALLVGISGIVSAFFVISLYAPTHIPWAHSGAVNVLTQFASVLGLWIVAVIPITLAFAMHRTLSWWARMFAVVALILHCLAVVSIALPYLYILVAFAVSIVVLSAWQHDDVVQWVRAIGVLLIASSIAFAVAGTPNMLKGDLPAELTLGNGVSTQITQQVLLKDVSTFFIGNGPASFGYAFSLYRPHAFNGLEAFADRIFWQPYSTVHALFVELGFVGALSLLFVVLLGSGVLVTGISDINARKGRVITKTARKIHPEQLHAVALGAAWLVLTIGMFVSFLGAALWMLWWWLLFMMCVAFAMHTKRLDQVKEISVSAELKDSFLVSFLFVSIVTALGISAAFGIRHIIAESQATAGLHAASAPQMIEHMNKATQLRPAYGPYRASLADAYLQYARALSKEDTITDEFTFAMANAVDQAKRATTLDPLSYTSWDTLATMYSNARLFTTGADEHTLQQLDSAIALAPTNAQLYWRKALIHIDSQQDAEAKATLEKAIQLHPQFVSAYAALGDIYERLEQFQLAVKQYEKASSLVPGNVDITYQYARVLYNTGERDQMQKAIEMWLALVDTHPDHSNGLFSLGIAAERIGNKPKAIEFYTKVLQLNPENEDIKKKIQSLK
ncbi:MAG: tetratricopeptide repeat protein [Candidatus Magasanikbacteria bacterium]|jgi:tetratricopeptide (TPR) repeat protein|nr:tetratricopeptide repeat protein [Candidatus Magasanikbacteria bacterium]